jgi:hypothetical protein
LHGKEQEENEPIIRDEFWRISSFIFLLFFISPFFHFSFLVHYYFHFSPFFFSFLSILFILFLRLSGKDEKISNRALRTLVDVLFLFFLFYLIRINMERQKLQTSDGHKKMLHVRIAAEKVSMLGV